MRHARFWANRLKPEGDVRQTRHSRDAYHSELILEKFAAGHTEEQILDAHPHVTQEGIRDALAFAAEAFQASVVYPLERVAS